MLDVTFLDALSKLEELTFMASGNGRALIWGPAVFYSPETMSTPMNLSSAAEKTCWCTLSVTKPSQEKCK